MALPGLFKISKNKQFEYTPRYYDERKERIDKLKQEYSKKDNSDVKFRPNIKGQIRKHYQENRQSVSKTSKIRFLIAIILSALLLYYTLS